MSGGGIRVRSAEWEDKCWGRVQHDFFFNRVAVSCLETRRGFRCSCHYHRDRNNLFIVQSGTLAVEVWTGKASQDPMWFVIQKGETLAVPARLLHRFTVLVDGYVTEVYTPNHETGSVSHDDITRIVAGGPVDIEHVMDVLREKGRLP